jgi:hypothetical protein
MEKKDTNSKKSKRQVIYVKPVFSYDEVVEIIEEQIEVLEKIAREKEAKEYKKKRMKGKQ